MEKSKTKKRFTTKKVWTKKKNGLYGWGVRRQRMINSSECEGEVTIICYEINLVSIRIQYILFISDFPW